MDPGRSKGKRIQLDLLVLLFLGVLVKYIITAPATKKTIFVDTRSIFGGGQMFRKKT